MTSLVLAFAAGAAASSFGLGPIGVGLAQMAGGLLGNALFGPRMPDVSEYGTRLTDLRITTSGYGSMVPIVFGTMRISSNIIWSTEKVETQHVSSYETGSKGGGGGTVTQTSYTYSVSFASGLCRSPMDAVRRIWANGNLICDIGENASQNSVAASSSINMRLHRGDEAELPDSLIEAHVGDTPAYRGTAYMLFEDLQLAPYGNEIPNLEYEVAANSSRADLYRAQAIVDFNPYSSPTDSPSIATISGNMVWAMSQGNIFLANPLSGSVRTLSLPLGRQFYWGGGTNLATKPDGSLLIMEKPYSYMTGNLWIVSQDMKVEKFPMTVVGIGQDGYVLDRSGILWAFGDAWRTCIYRIQIGAEPVKVVEGLYNTARQPLCYIHPHIYFREISWLKRFDVERMVIESLFDGGYYGIQGVCPDPGGGIRVIHADIERGFILTRRTLDGAELESVPLPEPLAWASSAWMLVDSKGMIWVAGQQPPRNLWRYDPGSSEWSRSESIGPFWNSTGQIQEHAGSLCVLDLYRHLLLKVDMEKLVTLTATRLSDVFLAICKMAGLAESEIDASLLEGIELNGYVISNRTTARSMLEPLMQAYFIDAVESDGKVRFVPRGALPIPVIAEEELAAHKENDDLPDDLFTVRQQESELPLEVSVSYYDRDADYQSGIQYSRRLITSSKNRVKVDLPIALSASQAKKISEVLLYDAWMGRNTCKFSTSMKYIMLEPTDVIAVERKGKLYTVRITRTVEESGIIQFEAVMEDPSIYVRDPAGSPLPSRNREIYRPSPTDLRILDIPLLRDMDDYPGVYLAACGYSESWPGAQLYASSDEGASFQISEVSFLSPSTMGYSMSKLGEFKSGNIFDELNLVDIRLEQGELESKSMLAILNGSNAAILGSEILQFRDAELVGSKTYRLSGLLRGRLGTECAFHEAGESFVLLDVTLKRVRDPSGIAMKLKAATFGTYLNDARTIEFRNQGNSDRPLSPVHLGGGRDSEGSIELKWVRRSRTGREWRDFADAPLGEDAEAWEIDILDNDHVVRTIASNIQIATYSAQEQVLDFGSIRNPVDFRVFQLSSRIGRGFAARGMI